MARRARDEARSLELVIRAAEAEQRLYARRLDRTAEAQRRARADIERELRREHYGRLPEGWPDRNGGA